MNNSINYVHNLSNIKLALSLSVDAEYLGNFTSQVIASCSNLSAMLFTLCAKRNNSLLHSYIYNFIIHINNFAAKLQ